MTAENDEILRRRNIVASDRNATSTKLSELVRFIGFGLAGLCFALLTSSSPFAQELMTQYRNWVFIISAFGCLTILCDLLQYLVGYLASLEAYGNVEKRRAGRFIDLYQRSIKRKLREYFFWGKIAFGILGASALTFVMFCAAVAPKVATPTKQAFFSLFN